LLGISQIEDEDKRSKFRKFADTFLKSCIETWKNTETGIAPESWSWTPQNNQLETKLNQLFDNTLKTSNAVNKIAKKTKVTATEKRHLVRTFSVSDAIYDLRPGMNIFFNEDQY
jgi:mannosyl-oligosaccharide alpha-1,2-mannosidase